MNPAVQNSVAIVCGLILGGVVNMGVITMGAELVPPPLGADVSSMEGLAEYANIGRCNSCCEGCCYSQTNNCSRNWFSFSSRRHHYGFESAFADLV